MENPLQKYIVLAVFGALMLVSVVQAVQLWRINDALSDFGGSSAYGNSVSQTSGQDTGQDSGFSTPGSPIGAQMVGGC
ncbi:MAG: hypothetical protein QS98_C0004G0003 [archaeon GW2011_AR3]|nr:MAG: hypothetical protein QS98_C0004G0003 [archaeon GW2011_AR3]MBS3109556.1 hypothetical protein [Candidatus Woesearchaeota archaeon]